MKTQYRILRDRKWFIPQYKKWYWPFWTNCVYNWLEDGKFRSELEAKDIIYQMQNYGELLYCIDSCGNVISGDKPD